jgi:hypothetical protein
VDLRPGPPTFTPCNAEINSFAQRPPLNPNFAILAGSLLSWTASFFRPAISLSHLFPITTLTVAFFVSTSSLQHSFEGRRCRLLLQQELGIFVARDPRNLWFRRSNLPPTANRVLCACPALQYWLSNQLPSTPSLVQVSQQQPATTPPSNLLPPTSSLNDHPDRLSTHLSVSVEGCTILSSKKSGPLFSHNTPV